jgi:hypothetical protein
VSKLSILFYQVINVQKNYLYYPALLHIQTMCFFFFLQCLLHTMLTLQLSELGSTWNQMLPMVVRLQVVLPQAAALMGHAELLGMLLLSLYLS